MRWSAVLLALLAPSLAAGCGSDGDAEEWRAQIEERRGEVDDAYAEVVGSLGAELGIAVDTAEGGYASCGPGLDARGVEARAVAGLGASSVAPAAAAEAARGALAPDWEVQPVGSDAVVSASRGDVEVRVEFGAATTALTVTASCVEASTDLVEEYRDKEAALPEPGGDG